MNREQRAGSNVVIGLMAVKGLSVSGAEEIINERERGGNFSSLDDFTNGVRFNRDDIIRNGELFTMEPIPAYGKSS